MPLPSSLSPSQLNTWLDCEQKWAYSYVDKLKSVSTSPLFFDKGTYIHELLHHYYSLLKTGFKIGDDIIITAMRERIKDDLQYAEKLAEEHQVGVDYDFYQAAARVVMQYVENFSPTMDRGISNLQIEEHLQVEEDSRNFHGFVDLIYERDGQTFIRDAKSGKQNTYKYNKVANFPQLMFYGTLYYKLTGKVANVEILWLHSMLPHTITPKTRVAEVITVTTHTATTYENFWKYLIQINAKQASLEPMRNLSSCAGCNYNPICRAELRGLSSTVIKAGLYNDGNKVSEGHSDKPNFPFVLNIGNI